VSAGTFVGIRAILLDFYGTLVDLNDDVRSAGFDVLASKLDLPLRPGELFSQYTELISRENETTSGDVRFATYRDSWVEAGDHLLGRYGLPGAGQQFAEAYAELHANAIGFPDVHRALDVLRHRFCVAVVANADRDFLADCLSSNGLEFDVVVDSQSMRCYKPESRIFHEACHRLSVEPGRCAMVGDTPGTDISGARRVGMPAVWINRMAAKWPHEMAPPDAVITNLSELADLCTADRG
jgi:2-haloalkanoic acid dehalogenase type II